MPVEATVPIHIVAPTAEVKEVGDVSIALVGRGAPTAAVPTNAVTRRPVAVARSRKKDTVAIGSRYSIAVYATLACPCPSAFVYEFFHLSSGR